MNYWLDLGVSGFRLDAITYMKKKKGCPLFRQTDRTVWFL